MKRLALVGMLAFLLSGGLAADPIYQIRFTGTITAGKASGFNPSISGNSLTQFADLAGVRVSGFLNFDLGPAPPPDVSIDGSGFITTSISSTSLPVFVSENFTIEGFTVPGGFFPMPTVFSQQQPIPSVPGSTVTTLQSNQSLSSGSRQILSVQSILGGMNFQNSWSGPQFNGGNVLNLDVLISGSQPFFPVPPIGSFPDAWGPAAVGGNGLFGFSVLMGDSTIPQNFGITQWYDVNGRFYVDSASGSFVTPEPGSLALAATGLALVATGVRRKYGSLLR